MATQRFGGSFAPPLTDELLDKYENLAAGEGPVQDAMRTLLKCVRHWWKLPWSGPDGSRPHPSGRGIITPLDEPIAQALYDDIPWEHELEAIQRLFDGIDPDGERELRNSAFHLLWHVKELNLDREPLTNDRL